LAGLFIEMCKLVSSMLQRREASILCFYTRSDRRV
jgi:hypothetical protein